MIVKVAIPNPSCRTQDFADVNPLNFDKDGCKGCSFFRMCKLSPIHCEKCNGTGYIFDFKDIDLESKTVRGVPCDGCNSTGHKIADSEQEQEGNKGD